MQPDDPRDILREPGSDFRTETGARAIVSD
jgi:hypothetical protein